MSDVSNEADHDALRRTRRRNMLRALPLLLAVIALWRLGDHWLRRNGVDGNLAWFGSMFAVLAVVWLLERLGVINRNHRPTEPRLRVLMEARAERLHHRLRWLFIVVFGVALALDGLHLVVGPGRSGPSPAFGGWSLLVLMLVPLTSDRLGSPLPWSTNRPRDPGHEARGLAATRRGYATLMLLGLAALILDVYRPGLLPTTLAMVLIAGLLVTLLSLALAPRTPSDAGPPVQPS